MISSEMTKALNGQLNAELYSSYLYLSMSAYASFKGLKGAASWFYVQVKEELFHVQKMYDYIESQGARVILNGIDSPPTDFGSVVELFNAVLAHEQKVTGLINTLMEQAVAEKDHATQTYLQWFITEQTEEEMSCHDIVNRLQLAGETGPGLFMIDTELGARVFNPPAM